MVFLWWLVYNRGERRDTMTDLEIASSVSVRDIREVSQRLGLREDELCFYGKDKAKVQSLGRGKNGKLILVTAINPTPYGEGKTTVSIGLADAFSKLSQSVCLSLRQPSLGPVFGLKGGATGGGYSQVVPMVDINLHFTGDFHAITAANNLISAAIYNHIEQGNLLDIKTVTFHRCLDVNDRSLRHVKVVCNKEEYGDSFRITAASEVMALFCLATSLSDLKMRLSKIIVGYNSLKQPVFVSDLRIEGALTVLLKDAFVPNLVQTLEGTPCLIHGGPFANIAHGCSSVQATSLALSLSDYVITEAGFGSDLGAEKFLDMVCPIASFSPDLVVLVATVRALKHHGEGDLEKGLSNLQAHIDHLKEYHIPLVVCINRFSDDSFEDVACVKSYVEKQDVPCEESTAYVDGGNGAIRLAETVCYEIQKEHHFTPLFDINMPITEKLRVLAKKVYHAEKIEYTDLAKEKLKQLEELGLMNLPLCVSKTQYSISDDAKRLGYPLSTTIHVSDIFINHGAGFVTVLLGNVLMMPGLPKIPNYEQIDLVDSKVVGIF